MARFSRSDGWDYRRRDAPACPENLAPLSRSPRWLPLSITPVAMLLNRLKAEGPGLGFHAVQIAGRDPSIMAEAARLAQDSGAAMIDINMGCPGEKVTNGYVGSHLMRDMGWRSRLFAQRLRPCIYRSR
jgi:hypothetical protein